MKMVTLTSKKPSDCHALFNINEISILQQPLWSLLACEESEVPRNQASWTAATVVQIEIQVGIWLSVGANDYYWIDAPRKRWEGQTLGLIFLLDYSIHGAICSLNVTTHSFSEGFIW